MHLFSDPRQLALILHLSDNRIQMHPNETAASNEHRGNIHLPVQTCKAIKTCERDA